MGFSGLVSGVILTPYFTKMSNKKVDSIAIHSMSGNLSAENCGYWFAKEKPRNQQASSNYGIDGNGIIYGYVDEDNASWCTSSSGVDRRAITIEVASTSSREPYEATAQAYESLIKLLTDICMRHRMSLRWMNDKNYALQAARGGPVDRQNMFVHRWFHSGKSCPGNYLFGLQGKIADDVNARLRRGGANIPLYINSTYDSMRTIEGKSTCIFIGDSRTVGMKNAIGSNSDLWSCKESQGLSWMKSVGIPNIESRITSTTGVCILMGINDLSYVDAGQYSKYINECASKWSARGASTYFVSVNPVGNNLSSGLNNQKIQEWNQQLRNGLDSNVGYIDTFSVLINNFNAPDGLHYDKETYRSIYQSVKTAVQRGSQSMIAGSSMIGGSMFQINYTSLNPYVITIDRNTSDSLQYDQLKSKGIVGAIIEAGYLYDSQHQKVTAEQPKLESQIKSTTDNNLEFGLYFTTRAVSVAEAESEFNEFKWTLRHHPPKLGVWLKLKLSSAKSINDQIIEYYENQLKRLGYFGKIGLYTDKQLLEKISWDRFQDTWLLWIVEHVEDTSELKRLLDPEFFDMDGVN